MDLSLSDFGVFSLTAEERIQLIIDVVYLPQSEIFVEPTEVLMAPKIAQTPQIHKV